MSELNKLVETVGIDRLLHLMVCLACTIIVALVCHKVGETSWVAAAVGSIVAVCVGVTKEMYDFFTDENFDTKDLLADICGAAIGLVVAGVLV